MTITGATWTPRVNLLAVLCECGRTIDHPADRWTVRCRCGRTAHLGRLRDEYARRHGRAA
jgi:hypothetical protein